MGAAVEFEWDPDKADRNWQKHKIDFETAAKVFDDVFRLEIEEPDDDDVMRYNVIGMVEGRLLVVTYTTRGDCYRIISARLADRHERRGYHET
jgi:uncharacterized DUF497 family protein